MFSTPSPTSVDSAASTTGASECSRHATRRSTALHLGSARQKVPRRRAQPGGKVSRSEQTPPCTRHVPTGGLAAGLPKHGHMNPLGARCKRVCHDRQPPRSMPPRQSPTMYGRRHAGTGARRSRHHSVKLLCSEQSRRDGQTMTRWSAFTRFGFLGLGSPRRHRVRVRALSSSSTPLVSTLVARLRASTSTDMMHAYLLKTAYVHMLPVANSLLAIYEPSSAAKLFDEMPLRDHVSWTSIIGAACVPAQAVALFRRMLLAAVRVDGVVLVVLLRASAELRDVHLGSSLHALATRRGLLADVFVANSLVHMYSECLCLRSARNVFDSIANKNIVSWNTMLSGLLHADRCPEALLLFQSTGLQGRVQLHLHADATTLSVLLQLCKRLGHPSCCGSVHAFALRKLLLMASTPLVNALLDAYAKCGLVGHALRLFQLMPLGDRNIVTWSTVIAACAGSGRPHEAMAFFVAMRDVGQRPNSTTMLSLLEACANRAEIRASRCAHGVALRGGLASDLGVGNAIVDTYGKCGDLAGSRRVFDAMPVKDAVSWNSMIGSYGMNGHALDALALVEEMERDGAVKPNGVTLLAVLSACAHGGLVREGVASLKRLAPEYSPARHLTCIVDMLARRGDVESAAKIAADVGGPAAWSAVLSGCRKTRNLGCGRTNKTSKEAARCLVEIEPDNSAGYLMAAATSLVDNGAMRRRMRERGVEVMGGYSMVHIAGEEHKFASWDARHPQSVQVYAMLNLLHCHLMRKPPPPVPTSCVLLPPV